MGRLDLKTANLGRDRLDRDVVLLGAEHGLGFVADLDRDVTGREGGRRRTGENKQGEAEAGRDRRHGNSALENGVDIA
ncbi:hypothetical protein D3C87_1964020 [compost metagenome]